MCRPLKDIVAELENHYKECEFICSLEERVLITANYELKIKYMLMKMSNYERDVSFIIEHNYSYSIISRITLNLILTMAHIYEDLLSYRKVIFTYLMDENYDDNSNIWEEYDGYSQSIKKIISKLQENGIFEVDKIEKDDVLENMHIKEGFGGEVTPLVIFEKRLAYLNGAELLCCLESMLILFDDELNDLKMGSIWEEEKVLAEYYDLNYLLYAKQYWPSQQKNFRAHIAHQILRDNVTIEKLEAQRSDEIRNFETIDIGKIWRDYSEDKAQMALEMKRQKLSIEQWLYFFNIIFKIEEYERWINEMEHPNEIIDEKEYPESIWDKIFKDTIDVKKVKAALPGLLPDKPSIPNWYVVHKILEEINWLQDVIDTHFISWVKDVYGWDFQTTHFKSVNSALKKAHSLDWNVRTMTAANVVEDHMALANKIRSEFVKKMEGKIVKEDNTYYFKKPDLYIAHE